MWNLSLDYIKSHIIMQMHIIYRTYAYVSELGWQFTEP